MIKNYFFLNRFIFEANKIIQDSSVVSVFSQEKEKIIIELKKDSGIFFIECSVNPGFPYITIKERFSRARKNTIDFFSSCLSSKLTSVEIASNDRIIKICLQSSSIYFLIRGKYTNVILVKSNSEVEYFKNPPDDFSEKGFLDEIRSLSFIKNLNVVRIKVFEPDKLTEELRINYPILGKEILAEAKARVMNSSGEEIVSAVTLIIRDIFFERPAVLIDRNGLDVRLAVGSFRSFPQDEKIFFDELIQAINFYIGKKYFFEQQAVKKKKIHRYIEKELYRLSSKLNNLKTVIDRGTKQEEYHKLGNLLLINISAIRKGMKTIALEDIYEESKPVDIKLNEDLSPRKNVDLYFEKAKNDRKRFEKSQQLYYDTFNKFNSLKKIEEKLFQAKEPEDYELIMKELKIKEDNGAHGDADIQAKFKHYIIENRYHVYVGKDSSNNDLLTTKFARQNDYWFHARSVPGSHVVLRPVSSKEAVPKNILKTAASIAAYHSKAKTAGVVPVSYTLKKYVVKKKGMEPGKVALLREEVILVNPEIPSNCEFISND